MRAHEQPEGSAEDYLWDADEMGSHASVAVTTVGIKLEGGCNLGCPSCYMYQGENAGLRAGSYPMPLVVVKKTAQRLVESVLEQADHDVGAQNEAVARKRAAVIFHGGEPFKKARGEHLIAAASIFREIMKDAGIDLFMRVQTNAIGLNEENLRGCREQGLLVGVSIDGLPGAHNTSRPLMNGGPSWPLTEKGVLLLRDQFPDLFYKVLCTLGPHNLSDDPVETYEWLDSFRPAPIEGPDGQSTERGYVNFLFPHGNWDNPPPLVDTTGKQTHYADWLGKIFTCLLSTRDLRITRVPLFMAAIVGARIEAGEQTAPAQDETLGLRPIDHVFVEGVNGSIRGPDALKVDGNPATDDTGLTVFENTFADAARHPLIMQRLIGHRALSEQCLNCSALHSCGGGQFAHRKMADNFQNPSVYCGDLFRLTRLVKEQYNLLSRDAAKE